MNYGVGYKIVRELEDEDAWEVLDDFLIMTGQKVAQDETDNL